MTACLCHLLSPRHGKHWFLQSEYPQTTLYHRWETEAQRQRGAEAGFQGMGSIAVSGLGQSRPPPSRFLQRT